MNDTEDWDDPTASDGRDKLVFHYNREQRLEHAPENVKRAYREGYTPNRGFIRGLTANVGLKSILFVIIALVALITFLTVTGISGAVSIGGISMRVKAFLFEDKVFITLTCEENPKYEGLPIPVNAKVRMLDKDKNVLDEREISGTYSGKQILLRTVLPDHETDSLTILVKAGETDSILSVTVDRK